MYTEPRLTQENVQRRSSDFENVLASFHGEDAGKSRGNVHDRSLDALDSGQLQSSWRLTLKTFTLETWMWTRAWLTLIRLYCFAVAQGKHFKGQNVSKYSRIFQNISKCSKSLHFIAKYSFQFFCNKVKLIAIICLKLSEHHSMYSPLCI